MKQTHNNKPHKTTTTRNLTHHVSSEWPLLVFPVLFLTTLAILYAVTRSIERGAPTPAQEQRTGQEQAVTPDRSGPADHARGDPAKLASGLAPHPGDVTNAGENQTPPDRAAGSPGRPSSVVGKMQHAVDLSRLKGTAKTVALLRIAVDEKDHAKIKQYLAELVAMGDEAVIPLSNLLADEEGDAALWAATALARIGTPMAAATLLDRLSQTQEGAYKEELGKRIAGLSNHDSWPLLLDTLTQSSDPTVVRAAGAALSAMADAPIIDEVIARYDSATTEAEIDRLAQLVRTIQSPKATDSLLSLAGNVSSAPQDSLQEAAIEALAKIGDAQCISHLLQRLEASPPGQDTQLFNTITRIDSPEAQASLLYAAAGNKEVSAEHGQTAAIYALKNYPNEQTVALLERLMAQGQNEKVVTAATRTLEDINRGPHAVTAKADALQKSEQMLPLKPLVK
jgi:HEAT repeat protein